VPPCSGFLLGSCADGSCFPYICLPFRCGARCRFFSLLFIALSPLLLVGHMARSLPPLFFGWSFRLFPRFYMYLSGTPFVCDSRPGVSGGMLSFLLFMLPLVTVLMRLSPVWLKGGLFKDQTSPGFFSFFSFPPPLFVVFLNGRCCPRGSALNPLVSFTRLDASSFLHCPFILDPFFPPSREETFLASSGLTSFVFPLDPRSFLFSLFEVLFSFLILSLP